MTRQIKKVFSVKQRIQSIQTKKEQLEKEIELLLKYEYMHNYFAHLKNNQNMYAVVMRAVAAEFLTKQGLNSFSVSPIIHRNHPSIFHFKTRQKFDPEALEVVTENWHSWIENGLIPHVTTEPAHNSISKHGYSTRTILDLRPIEE